MFQVILAEAGHPKAEGVLAELRRRLLAQLAQLPDELARQRFVDMQPHWRAAAGR